MTIATALLLTLIPPTPQAQGAESALPVTDRRASVVSSKQVRAIVAKAPETPQESQEAIETPAGYPWEQLAFCESSGRWDIYNPPYQGGLQFHHATWDAYRLPGYPEDAHLASPAQQVAVATLVQQAQGWGAWPHCSQVVGLR